MKTILISILSICLASCALTDSTPETSNNTEVAHKQPEPKPTATPVVEKAPALPFSAYVPKGYQIVRNSEGEEVVFADVNKDGIEDAVALFAGGDSITPEDYDFGTEVRLAVFLKDQDGIYHFATQSGDLQGESIRYKTQKHLEVSKKGVISFFHQSMRHHVVTKYRFEPKHDDFMLIGKEYHNYGNGYRDGAVRISINYLTGVRIQIMNDFDEEKEEQFELPPEKTTFEEPLVPLSKMDEEGIYQGV